VGRLARVVQHKPARRAGKTARRSGSGAERGVRPRPVYMFKCELVVQGLMPGRDWPALWLHRGQTVAFANHAPQALTDFFLVAYQNSFNPQEVHTMDTEAQTKPMTPSTVATRVGSCRFKPSQFATWPSKMVRPKAAAKTMRATRIFQRWLLMRGVSACI